MKLTIRTKILIGFALLLILSSLVQALTFNIVKQYISSQISETQMKEAERGAREIEYFFEELTTEISAISTLVGKETTSASSSAELASVANHLINTDPYIQKISILSPVGKELKVFSPTGEVSQDKLSYEISTQPFKSAVAGTTAISKMYYKDPDTHPHIEMYTPIFGNDKKVTGVVQLIINLDHLKEIVKEVQLGNKGYIYVVDNEGRLIAHPSDAYLQKRPNLSSRKIIADALTNTTPKPEDEFYKDDQGETLVAKAVLIKGYDWVIVFCQPVTEAYGFLTFINQLFFVTLIGSSILLLLIALMLSENITKPIRKLQIATLAIHNGNFDTSSFTIRSGDEIETLSNSFTSMVTQLLQRENSLRKEKQETDILLQSLTDGVVALDQNNSIIAYNRAAERYTGFNAQNVMGKNVDEILHFFEGMELIPFSIYNDQSEAYIKKLKDKGLSLITVSGDKNKISLTTAPIVFGDQRTGFIITFHDLSKEFELEEMKLDFVSMAAHELRTPLTAIRGYAALLEMQHGESLDDSGKELIHRLQISSGNLGSLIDNLLSVSRIERNMFTVELKPVDLTSTIQGVVDNIRQTAQTKNQNINLGSIHELPVVMADSFRIGQVLSNLIANAINYTQEGGTITVAVDKKDGYLQFSVTDNGQGVPKEALGKLFTKFFRVAGKLEQGSKGTGLGLFISKSIIVMHNGKIWAESELGKGSTFAFNLPIANSEKIASYQLQASQSNLTLKNGQGIIIRKSNNATKN